MTAKKITAGLAIIAALFIVSCASYAPNVSLPAGMTKLSVPLFINKTDRYNMEQYVTQKTIDKFLSEGRVTIVDEKDAEGIVKCRMTRYINQGTRFDVNQVPMEYMLRISVDIYLFDNKAQKLLWKEENIYEETTYFVANNLGMPIEDEAIARTRVLDKLADRIIRRVIHGWTY